MSCGVKRQLTISYECMLILTIFHHKVSMFKTTLYGQNIESDLSPKRESFIREQANEDREGEKL